MKDSTGKADGARMARRGMTAALAAALAAGALLPAPAGAAGGAQDSAGGRGAPARHHGTRGRREHRANAARTADWPSYGLDYGETRFSKLDQINTGNAKGWARHGLRHRSTRGGRATPIVVDGVMYVSAPGASCMRWTRAAAGAVDL